MILLNVVRAACNVDVLITLCLFLCMANGVKAFSNNKKDNVCSLPAFIYLLTSFSWSWLCLWRFLFLLGHTYDYSSVTGGELARALISRGENFCVFITLSPCNIDISIRLLDQCYVALQLSIDLNIETGSSTYYTNFVNALRSLTDDSGKTVFRTHSR